MVSWKDLREKTQAEDRYYKVYPEKAESFWFTLDAKLVAWTFRLPAPLGVPARLVLSVVTNRREPMPIGNRSHVNGLYADRPDWYRWLRWHLRNWSVDLKTYYLGLGYAREYGSVTSYGWGPFMLRIARYPWIPVPVPYPYFDADIGPLETALGWKQRGSFGGKLRWDLG